MNNCTVIIAVRPRAIRMVTISVVREKTFEFRYVSAILLSSPTSVYIYMLLNGYEKNVEQCSMIFINTIKKLNYTGISRLASTIKLRTDVAERRNDVLLKNHFRQAPSLLELHSRLLVPERVRTIIPAFART